MTLVHEELREDIDDVTRQVWDSILSLSAEPGAPGAADATTVASSVQILGGWNGAVLLTLTPALATTIASTMFMMEPADLSDDEIVDAVGEMANMIGGNIKSLLPGPSQLSMPTVTDGVHPSFPGTEVVERLDFSIEGEPFTVTLMGERSASSAADEEGADR